LPPAVGKPMVVTLSSSTSNASTLEWSARR
jgi:hypothetical protein